MEEKREDRKVSVAICNGREEKKAGKDNGVEADRGRKYKVENSEDRRGLLMVGFGQNRKSVSEGDQVMINCMKWDSSNGRQKNCSMEFSLVCGRAAV